MKMVLLFLEGKVAITVRIPDLRGNVFVPRELLTPCYEEIRERAKISACQKHDCDPDLLSVDFSTLSDAEQTMVRATIRTKGRIRLTQSDLLFKDICHLTVRLLNGETMDQAVKNLTSANLKDFPEIKKCVLDRVMRLRKKIVSS